jgi:putative PIN family toxin of toxin-antitoxin system
LAGQSAPRRVIVTLDTGILIRATARSNGPARRLVQIIANTPSHVLALSPFILDEAARVLTYPRLQQALGITSEGIREHLRYPRGVARIVDPDLGDAVVLNDPNDDPVVYTAVAAGAQVLCACDRHFYAPNVIAFCQQYRLEIMNDIGLLAKLENWS